MSQVRTRNMRPWDFVRSRAFRVGYEDWRNGQPPRFGAWGNSDLAYEFGRLVAAFATGSCLPLRAIPTSRGLADEDMLWLSRLLVQMTYCKPREGSA